MTALAVCIAGFLALCMSTGQANPQSTANAQPPASLCGHWTVTKIIPTSGISTSPRKGFLAVEVEYLPSEMRFAKDVIVHHALYATKRQSVPEFFKESYIRPSELGIKGDSVLVVNVLDAQGKDVIGPGTSIFVRNSNEVITVWDGVYYLLKRKGAACGDASSEPK